MCQRKHTNWSCGHHTIRLAQCEPPARSCLALLFRRRCRASDVLRTRDERCPDCCASAEATVRRSAEIEARRSVMVASYRAHKAGVGRRVEEGAAPDAAPEPAVVANGIRTGPKPPLLSSRDRSRVSREAYRETDAGDEGKPVNPGHGVPPSEARTGRRPVAPRRGAPPRRGNRWDPVNPRNCPGRAPEEWVCIPLY